MASERDLRVDTIVVGAGMAGTTMALALAKGGLSVAIIERQSLPQFRDPTFDGRTSAIAFGSANVFDGIGVWTKLGPSAQPIWDIRVADGTPWDGPSSLFLHYNHEELGETPLGYILENRDIRNVLLREAAASETVHLLAPAVVECAERGAGGATVMLADGQRIAARLIVGADGRNSPLREAAGIRATRFDYPQTAIVCTVTHERPHAGVAVELFLPSGPFAMLPMTEQRSSVVWTEKKDLAQNILALDEEAFHYELKRRFGDWLGDIRVEGPRFAYPLGLMHAENYTDRRLALIGDAAHVIHPIAGQGLNMGMRDVAALTESLVDAYRLGLDIGDDRVLARYERWRRFDNVFMAATTDVLNQLFSNNFGPLRLARDLGLAAIDRFPPAKRFLMRHAMGIVGDLPRLVKGEPI